MEIDASNFVVKAILLQSSTNEKLHLVAFHSKKFSIAEINYKIHNKELLEIMDSFQEWHHFLKSTIHQVTVYIDYKNLKYFMSIHVLNHCKALWNMSLSRFDFTIINQPSNQKRLSNALSRQSYFIPKEGEVAYDQ